MPSQHSEFAHKLGPTLVGKGWQSLPRETVSGWEVLEPLEGWACYSKPEHQKSALTSKQRARCPSMPRLCVPPSLGLARRLRMLSHKEVLGVPGQWLRVDISGALGAQTSAAYKRAGDHFLQKQPHGSTRGLQRGQ